MEPYKDRHNSDAERLPAGLKLVQRPAGLTLTDGAQGLRADFTELLPRLRKANMEHELLVRAARIRGFQGVEQVVDATAGLGTDSLLLAAAGFEVTMYEQNPVICALLEDALTRGRDNPELLDIVSRVHLRRGDSIEGMRASGFIPDVILLDPMFPERQKSAAVKKKFQLLHQLELPCGNEEELLRAAFEARPRRVIVKRPAKGPLLAGRRPDYALRGKAVRYDVFVLAR